MFPVHQQELKSILPTNQIDKDFRLVRTDNRNYKLIAVVDKIP